VRLVPTTIIDVAGIVPGAHEGKGLGNQFLDDIRRASVLIHVVDASGSTDEGGNPVNKGAHDPLEDVAFLEREIDLWFASVFSRHWEKVSRKIALTNKNIFQVVAENFSGIGIGEEDVHGAVKDAGLDPERPRVWTEDDITSFAMHIRTRTKPIVIAANKADIADDDQIAALQKGARNVVPVSAGAELLLRKARDASLIDYVPGESDFSITGDVSQKQGEALERVRAIMRRWGSTGVQSCINTAVFDILDRIVVYPVENEKRLCDGKGAVLPDALLLRRGATPMDLAEKIHSDIAKNYIYALNVRTNRRIAEDCELCSGDIIKIASAAR
jgi:hypothetical protein